MLAFTQPFLESFRGFARVRKFTRRVWPSYPIPAAGLTPVPNSHGTHLTLGDAANPDWLRERVAEVYVEGFEIPPPYSE